jgi:hypothetical protein
LLDDALSCPNFTQTPLDADDLGLESRQLAAEALQRRLHVALMSVLRISVHRLRDLPEIEGRGAFARQTTSHVGQSLALIGAASRAVVTSRFDELARRMAQVKKTVAG